MTREPLCMMCSSPDCDAGETEVRYEDGKRWEVWWTYCRACDCWTEHTPELVPLVKPQEP